MIRHIALALTIATISTGASAQPVGGCKGWTCGAEPIAGSKTEPATDKNPLLDGCVISAIGQLPKVDGMKVTNTSYQLREPNGSMFDFYTVSVSVDLHGRQSTYQWLCRVYANREAQLLRMP